ncbi:inorganic phosphate transporter [Micrococcus sp. EYE_162]|uniref:inorganic phosphate transporter n=1 Tax=unclassified Micrococcus TaxID=2620948 RepID=UPI0020055B5D|nr:MULTISPECIES: inorganic phosphate transporter [unclassified Micrococcus]MCK6096073.1 inorganic phosphate transporter [Micrococcus sp. EYE_212]MCK6172164.1 inorganic phosphate transporter [Micrococcus sp. EYE_162]
MTAGLGIVFALLCLFGVVMGFRDAPNSVALPVRFRALTPRLALVMAALLNGIGVVLGMGLITLSVSFFTPHVMSGVVGHITVATAVLVAVAWGLLMWWRRIPGSTTHALLAALAGAHLASHLELGHELELVVMDRVGWEVAVGLLLSPLLAWGLARVLTPPLVRLGTTGSTVNVQHRARIALAVSGGATAVGHGVQGGQRLGLLWAIFFMGAGVPPGAPTASWVFGLSAAVFALAMAMGTLGGAWRIAWTLTERLVALDPLRAAVAAAVPAGLLFVGSLVLHLPLSSTHTLTAGIVGAGQTQTYASVRWPQVLRVVAWWLLTPLACLGAALLLGLALLLLV